MQIQLKNLVLALGLSVGLLIVYDTEPLVDAQVVTDYCPELQGELGPTIRHDALQYASTS
jgi:hypothetical protein